MRSCRVALWVCCVCCGCAGAGTRQEQAHDEPDLGGPAGNGEADLGPGAPTLPAPPEVVNALDNVTVSTLAGSDKAGAADGTGAAAQFNNPVGIALDGNGLAYVTEYDGGRVRTVDASGVTHTLVSSGSTPALHCPFAVTVANPTTLVVQTDCDPTGKKNTTTGTLWMIPTNTMTPTPVVVVSGLGRPRGLATLDGGMIVASDRTIQTLSVLTLPAETYARLAGSPGQRGYADGSGAAALFDDPYGLCRLNGTTVLVADAENNRLRVATTGGTVTTLAGNAAAGMVDGARDMAYFSGPKADAADAAGDVFVSDYGNHRIRRVAAGGTVATVAGDGTAGFRDGPGAQAELYGQEGIAVTPDGKTVYVTDGNKGDGSNHHRIRVITLQ